MVIEFAEDANWLGGSIYIENLLRALSSLPEHDRPIVRLSILTDPKSQLVKRLSALPVVSASGWGAESALAAQLRRLHRGLVRRFPLLGGVARVRNEDLYFPAFDATQGWRNNLYWIPDFQPLYLPHLFTHAELSARTRSFESIAASRGVLLLSSRAALADFREHFPNAVVEPRIWSFSSSFEEENTSSDVEAISRPALPTKFLYLPNHFWKHKDHETAFAAIRILKSRGVPVHLLCTGHTADRRDPDYYPELMAKLAAWGITDLVHVLGIVPRQEQAHLFRTAAAVLQPSRFEGWSTVVEDAKALGRPIVASDLPVHAEQLQDVDGARLFAAGDASALADVLEGLWPQWRPGPDLNSESRARERTRVFQRDSAYSFLQIARAAYALAGSRPNQGTQSHVRN